MEASRITLWEISDELREIAETLVENGGELTPELGERLDAMEGAFEEKAERIALYVRECEANAIAAQVEADRLAAIAESFGRKAQGMKDYLLFSMRRTGHAKITTPRVKIWEQKNGRPSIKCILAPSLMPAAFVKHPPAVVDTELAYQEWKQGNPLPEGFVVEQGSHLRIG